METKPGTSGSAALPVRTCETADAAAACCGLHQHQHQRQHQHQHMGCVQSALRQLLGNSSRAGNYEQQEDGRGEQMRALYSYEAQTPGDLSFKEGDLLEVLDASLQTWVWARLAADGSVGYAPANYLQPTGRGPESLDCWFDVDRHEAVTLLLMPGQPAGTFLLRPCHQMREAAKYTLSLRCLSEDGQPDVRHYLLRPMDDGGFYIHPSHTFPCVEELLQFYRQPDTGMACPLLQPCPRDWRPPTQFRDFEVNRSLVVLGERVGQGNFGEVYKARMGNMEVAVKTLREGTMRREAFLAEGEILHQLRHPKILQLMGVCTKSEPVYLITELMPNGDLKSYLQKDRGEKKLKFPHMIDILQQVADGMSYLEEKNFIHRDLRAANILVGRTNAVKVADFGLSKFLEEDVYTASVDSKFPVRWTAPEAALPPFHVSVKSDVWSFGVLTYEVVTRGDLPYRGLQNIRQLVADGYRMPNPKAFGSAVQNEFVYDSVMTECWRKEPEERPTFARLKNAFLDCQAEMESKYDSN